MLHYFSKVFVRVTELKERFDESATPAFKLREELEGLLIDAMRTAVSNGVDPRQFDNARFAVTAWVDEAVMGLAWSDPMMWSSQLLQKRIYDTTQAGEQFYLRLESGANMPLPVLKVYYTCLAYGYRGRYCNKEDQAFIEGLQNTYYLRILEADGGVEDVVRDIGSDVTRLTGDGGEDRGKKLLIAIGSAILINGIVFSIYQYLLIQNLQVGF